MEEDISLVKAPRLCEMIKEGTGYGFNLHGEKGVVGQYISAVDPGGSADISGMCVGDRVVEVNGFNVETFSHAEVVEKIRENCEKTTLLVVDKITDSYLKKISQPITADLVHYSNVSKIGSVNEESIVDNASNHSADVSDGVNQTEEFQDDQSFPTYDSVPAAVEPTEKIPDAEKSPLFKPEEAQNTKIVNKSPTADPPESLRARPASIPKRKQVKQSKADWKAKQDLFNNL